MGHWAKWATHQIKQSMPDVSCNVVSDRCGCMEPSKKTHKKQPKAGLLNSEGICRFSTSLVSRPVYFDARAFVNPHRIPNKVIQFRNSGLWWIFWVMPPQLCFTHIGYTGQTIRGVPFGQNGPGQNGPTQINPVCIEFTLWALWARAIWAGPYCPAKAVLSISKSHECITANNICSPLMLPYESPYNIFVSYCYCRARQAGWPILPSPVARFARGLW